jgi:hypothetical protein
MVVLGGTATAQTPYYGNVTTSVAVDQNWTDTGLDVTIGQLVIITASGTAAASGVVQGVPQWFGPDGVGPNCEDPSKPFPWALNMLIGKVGDLGDAFPAGNFCSFTVDVTGRLFLGVNNGLPSSGSGCFMAVIYVIPCVATAVQSGSFSSTHTLKSYPNPVGSATSISFTLPVSGDVDLRVYDPAGRQVRALSGAPFGRGEHVLTWDGRDDSGNQVAPGVYFYTLSVDGRRQGSEKVVVIR